MSRMPRSTRRYKRGREIPLCAGQSFHRSERGRKSRPAPFGMTMNGGVGDGLRLGAAVGAKSGPGDATAIEIQADAVTFVPDFLAMGYFPADRSLFFE